MNFSLIPRIRDDVQISRVKTPEGEHFVLCVSSRGRKIRPHAATCDLVLFTSKDIVSHFVKISGEDIHSYEKAPELYEKEGDLNRAQEVQEKIRELENLEESRTPEPSSPAPSKSVPEYSDFFKVVGIAILVAALLGILSVYCFIKSKNTREQKHVTRVTCPGKSFASIGKPFINSFYRVIMRLLIDHREGKVLPIIQGLCEKSDISIQYEVTHLPLGDFLLISDTGGVLIERKSAPDFLSSIRSNRLWDQLLRFMKVSALLDYPIKRKLLIIHGTFDYEPTSQFWSQIMGAYMEILFVYDTPLILAENDEAFYQCIRILMKRELAGRNDLLPQPRWFRKHLSSDLPEMDRKRYILASLPMVGNVLAENLLNHFGSICAVANASEKQLQKVEGIGKMKARKIYQIFH